MKFLNENRRFGILVLIVFAGQHSVSQSLVNPGGATIRNNAFIVEYSIGEIAITTLTSPGNSSYVTQGLLQPSLKISTPECAIINDVLLAFPNPTTGGRLRIVGRYNWIDEYIIYAADGKLLARRSFFNNYIDISSLSAGVYFVRLLPGCNGQYQTLKIIKQNK